MMDEEVIEEVGFVGGGPGRVKKQSLIATLSAIPHISQCEPRVLWGAASSALHSLKHPTRLIEFFVRRYSDC
jgi:hypothetical protein